MLTSERIFKNAIKLYLVREDGFRQQMQTSDAVYDAKETAEIFWDTKLL